MVYPSFPKGGETIMKIKNVIWIILILALALVLGLWWATHTTRAEASAEDKVKLCHLTDSETNPWVVQDVKANEVQSHEAKGDFLYGGQETCKGLKGDAKKDCEDKWCADHQTQESCEILDNCPITPTPPPPPPSCTGNCGNPPTFAGSSTNPPVCSDGTTTQLPANVQVTRKGSEATVSFFITQGNSANIFYKVVGSTLWQYSVADVKPNGDKFVSYTIGGLDPALGYTFGVQQKQGCGGGQIATSVVVDGPETHVFGFSYWIW